MNKQTFLNELRKQLHVLEEAEVNDIIDEYSQHIDIKVAKGQTEEEAIKDFGSVKELSDQILLAYHVRTDRQGRFSDMLHNAAEAAGQEGKKAAESVSGYAKNVSEKMPGFFGRIKNSLKHVCSVVSVFVKRQYEKMLRFFVSIREKISVKKEKDISDTVGKRNTGILSNIIAFVKKTISFILSALILMCILAWNLFVIFVALFGIIVLLMSIFALGVALVFLLSGYPFTGIVLLLTGVTLCTGAAVVFILSLLIKRISKEKKLYIEQKAEA